MLIVAIPKSASTSLMRTLGKYHKMKSRQHFNLGNSIKPENCQRLHLLHSDVRQLTENDVELITDTGEVNKQHIYPSPENLEKLAAHKKVVLLRSIDDIVLAYRRGVLKSLHKLLDGYSKEMNEEQWMQQAKNDGLYQDLLHFSEKWRSQSADSNTLIIEFEDYANDPQKVVNQIEAFYNLPITQKPIESVKARYSRRSTIDQLMHDLTAWVKKLAYRTLKLFRLK